MSSTVPRPMPKSGYAEMPIRDLPQFIIDHPLGVVLRRVGVGSSSVMLPIIHDAYVMWTQVDDITGRISVRATHSDATGKVITSEFRCHPDETVSVDY